MNRSERPQSHLDQLRADLAQQFASAPQTISTDQFNRGRRRWAVVAVGLALVPASLAVGSQINRDDRPDSFNWDGEVLRMNGEQLDCPVSQEVIDEAGLDPCQIWSPASPPKNEEPAGTD